MLGAWYLNISIELLWISDCVDDKIFELQGATWRHTYEIDLCVGHVMFDIGMAIRWYNYELQ